MTNPLFTDEGPEYYNAAYQHNAPFAKPGPYMTQLSPAPEAQFRRWVKDNNLRVDVNEKVSDYDARGFWLAVQRGDAQLGREPDGSPGFDDRWKTPYDTTFSRESMYAKPDCPFVWQGDNLVDMRNGQLIFSRDPTQSTLAPTDQPDVPASFVRDAAAAKARHFDGGGAADTIVSSPNPPRIHDTMPGVNPSHGRDQDPWVGGTFQRLSRLGVMHPEYGGEDIINPWGREIPAGSRGSGYGTRWHLEVVHTNGQVSELPLRRTGGGDGHTNWTSDYQLRPGDQVRAVKRT